MASITAPAPSRPIPEDAAVHDELVSEAPARERDDDEHRRRRAPPALRGDGDGFDARADRDVGADVADRVRILADVLEDFEVGGALGRRDSDPRERLLLPPRLNPGDGALEDLFRERAAHG